MDYKEWILSIRDYIRSVPEAPPQDVMEYAYYHIEDAEDGAIPLTIDKVQDVISCATSAMIYCKDEAVEAHNSAASMSQTFMTTSFESNRAMVNMASSLLYDAIDYLRDNIVSLAHTETIQLKDELDDLVNGKGDTIFHRRPMQDNSEYYSMLRKMAELYNERIITLSHRLRVAVTLNQYNLMSSISESVDVYSKVINKCTELVKSLDDTIISDNSEGGEDDNGNDSGAA